MYERGILFLIFDPYQGNCVQKSLRCQQAPRPFFPKQRETLMSGGTMEKGALSHELEICISKRAPFY